MHILHIAVVSFSGVFAVFLLWVAEKNLFLVHLGVFGIFFSFITAKIN